MPPVRCGCRVVARSRDLRSGGQCSAVSVSVLIIIIIRYINLYAEPGIEATACARELLYVSTSLRWSWSRLQYFVSRPRYRCVLMRRRGDVDVEQCYFSYPNRFSFSFYLVLVLEFVLVVVLVSV